MSILETPREPFTWEYYAQSLDIALANGYVFTGYDRIVDAYCWPTEHFVLLRHDIDYDPICAIKIADLESERGIRATYFFQLHSPFYLFDDQSTQHAITEIIAKGHWLGLHFDATQILDDAEVCAKVENDAVLLERKFQCLISAVSFHMPTHRSISHLRLSNGRINTYSSLFFREIEYLSDSNQNWRGKNPLEMFTHTRPRAVQFLTHPIWWRRVDTPFFTILSDLAKQLGIDVYQDILTPEQLELLKIVNKENQAA